MAEASDRLGTTEAISRRPSGMRERRSKHDPGHVVRDLPVMLADGGGNAFRTCARCTTASRCSGRSPLDGVSDHRPDRRRSRAAGGVAGRSRQRTRERLEGGRGAGPDRDRHRRDADLGALGEGRRGVDVQRRALGFIRRSRSSTRPREPVSATGPGAGSLAFTASSQGNVVEETRESPDRAERAGPDSPCHARVACAKDEIQQNPPRWR